MSFYSFCLTETHFYSRFLICNIVLMSKHSQVERLAGAAHLLIFDNGGVPTRELNKNRNLVWTNRRKCSRWVILSTTTNCESMAYVSYQPEHTHINSTPKPNCWRSTPTIPGVQTPRENGENLLEVRRVAPSTIHVAFLS